VATLTFSALTRNNTATGLRPDDNAGPSAFRGGRFASLANGNVYGTNLANSISLGQYYTFTVAPVSATPCT
jgi:hypothetical protein